MRTIELPQGTIRYRAAGPVDEPGPKVVFVHGLLVNHELWSRVADRLAAAGIASYAPDLPLGSHTIALADGADVSPRGVAGLILDFLAALDLQDVTLVGNDTGGALCQFVIDRDDSRVGRLALTNCDAFDKFPPPPFGLLKPLLGGERRARTAGRIMRSTALRHSVLGFGGLVAKPLDPAMTARWTTPAAENPGVARDLGRFVRAIDPADLLDVSTRLARFRKPVRLIWGDRDPFFKLAFARRLAETFPNATLQTIAGGRTFVSLDFPDEVAAHLSALAKSDTLN